MIPTLALQMPGGWQLIIILVIALLIFGRRLPELGRSLGKGIVEFKKGLKGMKSEMDGINDEVNEAVAKDEEKEAGRLEGGGSRAVGEGTKRAVEEREKVES